MKLFGKVLVAAVAMIPAQAFAATGNIPFNGTVTATCLITVGSSGTIMPNAGFTVLGSTQAGGAPGTATILTTGNAYNVSVDSPASWSSAPASAAGTTFATAYDLTGANTASGVSGATTTTLAHGTTNVAVNLTATHPSGSFEAGTYTATAVLRCE